MPPAPHASRPALLTAFLAIYLVWGSTYLAIAEAVETIPPFLMAGARFAVSGTLLYGFLWFTKRIKPTAKQWRDNAIVGGFLMLGGNGLVSWAEQRISSSLATMLVSIGPLAVVLIDWAILVLGKNPKRGSRPNLLTLLGIAVGFVGLGVLVGPDLRDNGGTSGLDWLHCGALIAACFLWSGGSLYGRYASEPTEAFTASALQMLCGAGWLLAASFLLGEPARFEPAAVSAHSFWAWVYLTLIGSLVGFTAFAWLMQHSTPAKVYTYTYVNPIVAVFLGWWLRDEPVGPRMLVASGIIIAAVALITIAKTAGKPAASPAPTATPQPKAA
jgi:drug/metabolite transporter (DMT)-like permease